ncbi:uncharacterized protein LOC129567135 isoform X2 [Sitodiplosis mosellana]|uniref:uncharacterized protein LOC129567135 isoform X2 n=1 Tax=Sitodiplosis mosellana TaxID=263140 RepID=UPI00244517DE|nr:uncharacterized protein LOC129567135 isoform X2 [Sitodiplosis mosellana]
MDATEIIGDNNQTQNQTNQSRDESPTSSSLNGDATPFVPSEGGDVKDTPSYGTFTLKVPLDSKIWKSISACSPHNQRISTQRKPSPPRALQTNSFSEPHANRNLITEISNDGYISIRRKDNVFIDISLDRAIRIACPMQKILVCISGSTTNAVIFHPNGRIFQNNSRVDLVAFDGSHQNNLLRCAKIWQKGISFMAKDIPVVYLVDEAGLRSSVDHFVHIKKDCALEVFNKNIRHSSYPFDDAVHMMQKSVYTHEINGSETFEINQVRVTSNNDGTISIERLNKSCGIRINPRKAAITLTSSYMHATASMGKSPHLFLRQGDRRIHFDGAVFCVRNGGYSAGFDEKNQVTIFNKKMSPACINL